MATYPPIGDLERDQALRHIALLLERYDDPRRSEAGTEPREVLNYLRARHAALPRALTSSLVRPQLVLSGWLYWDERRRERELLKRTLHQGMPLAELGAFLGIRTRQGARDYLDRLDALLAEQHRSASTPETIARGDGATDPLRRYGARTRAERGAGADSSREQRASARLKPDRALWISRNHERITSIVRDLLQQCARLGMEPDPSNEDDLPDLGDYLSWLDEDLTRGAFDHGSFGCLGLVVSELLPRPAVHALAANHGLHQAIRSADRLRANYADLTREAGVAAPTDRLAQERGWA